MNGTLECPPQEDPHPYQDLPGGFSKHLQDALFPPWIIGRGSMTAWEARIVGEEWAREWGRCCAATRAPETPVQRYAAIPLKGWGPDTRRRPTVIRGAGPDHPWDAATGEWLQAAPGLQTGWTWDVSSLVRTPVPPRIVLHAANVLRAAEIRTWGHAAATVWWHPPEGGAAQLAVAHFKAGGPVYDDALSRLGNTQGPLLLMLPTNIAAALLRQELDGCEGLRVGWEAVADGTLLALLHRDTGNGCRWDALTPHLTGRHVYMATPPQGHPRPAWDDLIAAFHDHGILPDDTWQEVQRKTLGKDYRRRVCARLLDIRDPLRQRWDDLWLRHLDPWSPPSHLPHTCWLCGECDTVSSAASTGANRCARCAQVAACPWPEPPAGPRRRTEEEALHRRIKGAHTPSHERAGPVGAALPVDPRAPAGPPIRCAPVAPVRALTPPTAALCRARSTMPRRRGDGPGHTRARRKAQEAAVRGLVADAVAEAHEAHAAAQCDLTGSARAFLNETALPAVRALNGAGAPTLLPAMHRIVNAVQPGLISPEAALYGHWMEWRESNRSGRPVSMGDTLRLTGAGSAMSLRSSAPALLHALRTRYPGDAAPYLNQARATYLGEVSELDAALHLLHPPDEALEVGEITVFVEGADEASARPRPTNPVYAGTRPTPPYAIVCEAFPREPTWCPALPPATHAPRSWANPDLSPPSPEPWVPTTGGRSSGKSALAPPAPPRRRDPRGPGAGPWDHPHPPPLRGSTWCGSPRHHSTTPGGPGPWAPPQTGSYGATRGPRGSPASPPNADGWPPAPDRAGLTPQPAPHPLPPSPPQSTTRHCPRHSTDAPGGSGKGAPATTHAYQDKSDGRLRWLPTAG